jgi:hypothetical protein
MQPISLENGLPYEVSPSEIAERAAREVYEHGLTLADGQDLLNLLNAVARQGLELNGVFCVLTPLAFTDDFLLYDVSEVVVAAYKALVKMPGVEIVCELAQEAHPFDVETVWQHGGDVRWITPFRGVHCSKVCGGQPHWVKARVWVKS